MIRALEKILSRLCHYPELLVDRIGMYRTVTLTLSALVLISLGAGAFELLAYTVLEQLIALGLVLGITFGLNLICAKVWRVAANHESAIITALILFFMYVPAIEWQDNWPLIASGALAVLSKYVIVYRRQHILNPAATGMVLLVFIVLGINVLTGAQYNTDIFQWWIANPILFWPLLIFGSLVVFKIRKWTPVLFCIGIGLIVFVVEGWFRFEADVVASTWLYLSSFPVLFLAFFMLTEPFTMPPTWRTQAIYGAMVGVLSSTLVFAPYGIGMTPELALVIGNLFAYSYRIRQKLYLELIEKREIATDTWEFIFKKPDNLTFQPGQYLEWMLPHNQVDSRGPRRYFTIASSPTESVVRLALKIMPTQGSSYKKALASLKSGQKIIASQLAGDFLLPSDVDTKLGFIAGGIGVTPFSSHLRYLHDTEGRRDAVLYYCANTLNELAYVEDFKRYYIALDVVSVIGKEDVSAPYERGYITTEILDRRTPDWRGRTWYLSGPPGMVNAYYDLLRDAGLPRTQIKKDFFPGLS